MLIGVIAETHGTLREPVIYALQGVDHILHAGDLGTPEVLHALQRIAPVSAVRGNVDEGPELGSLPEVLCGDLGGLRFRLCHYKERIVASKDRSSQLCVFGHSHKPELSWQGNQLWMNPGACGRRRFNLPLTVGRIRTDGQRMVPELLDVEG